MFGRWLATLVALNLSACASARPDVGLQTAALRDGDTKGPPAFGVLPDVAARELTPRVQQGLSLARQVLANTLPEAPSDRRYRALQAWIDATVVSWIAARRDGVDETRFQFALEQGASDAEGVVARGVLGLLQESTALELTRIPSPAELDTEPEIAEMFRDLVSTQATPFRSAALAEYRQCAEQAAAEGGELSAWERFCAGRYQRLQAEFSGPGRVRTQTAALHR